MPTSTNAPTKYSINWPVFSSEDTYLERSSKRGLFYCLFINIGRSVFRNESDVSKISVVCMLPRSFNIGVKEKFKYGIVSFQTKNCPYWRLQVYDSVKHSKAPVCPHARDPSGLPPWRCRKFSLLCSRKFRCRPLSYACTCCCRPQRSPWNGGRKCQREHCLPQCCCTQAHCAANGGWLPKKQEDWQKISDEMMARIWSSDWFPLFSKQTTQGSRDCKNAYFKSIQQKLRWHWCQARNTQ